MESERLLVDPENPDPAAIALAAEILRSGGLVAFPTETVYGLGANALDPEAVARIYRAKGRPPNNPLIVHVPDAAAARRVVAYWPVAAAELASRFWPGPLTLVLPKLPVVPDIVTAGGPTVAVRVPAHPVALALIRAAGVPVAAPSANRSSRVSPTTAEHVARGLGDRIEIVLDGGPTPGGIESTVLDLTSSPPRILRPGPVSAAQIEEVIGQVGQVRPTATDAAALPSPGMLPRHYAPHAVLELCTGSLDRVRELAGEGQRVGWITFTEADAPGGVAVSRMPDDPAIYAQRLYAELHALDDAGVERIVADPPPDGDEWIAVRDRLTRAAS